MLIAFGIWMTLIGLVWSLILVKAVRDSRRRKWALLQEDPACPPAVTVSVVIPARNEENNIERAVRAVLSQDHPSVQLVVLDDGSTDRTAEILEGFDDRRLMVIKGGGEELPAGWLGKPWACQRAAKEATGDWLLFVDADVALGAEAVSRAVAYAMEHELGLLSGFGQLEVVSFAEHVMQPIVAGLILAGNNLDEVNDPDRKDKYLANGQFLLFSRSAYEALGGHDAVANNVLDDVGMAHAAKDAGLGFRLVFMRSLFSCRMYESGPDLWRGWRKNLFPGMRRSWVVLALLVFSQLFVVVGPYVALTVCLFLGWWTAAGLAAFPVLAIQSVRWHLDGVFGQSRWIGLLTHALANLLLAGLLLDSAFFTTLGRAEWKGRVIPNA